MGDPEENRRRAEAGRELRKQLMKTPDKMIDMGLYFAGYHSATRKVVITAKDIKNFAGVTAGKLVGFRPVDASLRQS